MAFKLRQMDAIFTKLAIKKIECKHHNRGFFEHDGKKILTVYYSFGSGDIPAFVTHKVAKSMGLNAQELKKMARCKISKEQYIKLLKERGKI